MIDSKRYINTIQVYVYMHVHILYIEYRLLYIVVVVFQNFVDSDTIRFFQGHFRTRHFGP